MSGRNAKKVRKEIKAASSDIYDEIKRQINALPLRQRFIFAHKILRGKW